MKEIYMLAGLGVGMIAGIALYKYCDGAKKLVDQTEKKMMKNANKIENSVNKEIKKMGNKNNNKKAE